LKGECSTTFFVGYKSGETKRALGEKEGFVGCQTGIFMARGTHSAIIEKIAFEKIRVVFYNVGFVLVKLIQF
jgi:hypothetical protein